MKEHNNCLNSNRILSYLNNKMGDDEIFEVEEHLSKCNTCLKKIRKIRVLHKIFDDWTAKSHGDVYRRIRSNLWTLSEDKVYQFDPVIKQQIFQGFVLSLILSLIGHRRVRLHLMGPEDYSEQYEIPLPMSEAGSLIDIGKIIIQRVESDKEGFCNVSVTVELKEDASIKGDVIILNLLSLSDQGWNVIRRCQVSRNESIAFVNLSLNTSYCITVECSGNKWEIPIPVHILQQIEES